MRIVVIGATGHIGTYLIPRLVLDGHEVIALSRGRRTPYTDPGIWRFVRSVHVDREKEEWAGTFGARIAAMSPDIVIDLMCFTEESAQHMVEAIKGVVSQYLFCGTIWVYGHSEVVPTTENAPRRPFGDYGIRKAAAEKWLLKKASIDGFPVRCSIPGTSWGRDGFR